MNASDRKVAIAAIESWKQLQFAAIGGRYRSVDFSHAPAAIRAARKQIKRLQSIVGRYSTRHTSEHGRKVAKIEREAQSMKLQFSFGTDKDRAAITRKVTR